MPDQSTNRAHDAARDVITQLLDQWRTAIANRTAKGCYEMATTILARLAAHKPPIRVEMEDEK